MTELRPRWLLDLIRFLPLRSQFVLSGNVRDQYPEEMQGGMVVPMPLVSYLGTELQKEGMAHFLAFDPAQGFSVPRLPRLDAAAEREFFTKLLGLTWAENGCSAASSERFFEVLEVVARHPGEPIVLFADFASRLVIRADLPSESEQRGFTRALVLSHQSLPRPIGPEGKPFFNPVLWIVDKEGDLPDWFQLGNPKMRHIPVPAPDHRLRRLVTKNLAATLKGDLAEDQVEGCVDTFVESTEGLLVSDLVGIAQLCRSEGLKLAEIGEGVRRYKLGVTEDPWKKVNREKLAQAETLIRRRVKGQVQAVTHMLDLVKRAVSGIGAKEGGGGRPRGVAFLAGPTGVGKTELAKTITELLFGDESACIRFDMSEFSAEHSDQRLIGAPPGYIGYDVGGELTNAIRQRPFSVVLFDEIEKAHPRILDKFLQVLDDGVLTSGRGERVYFSEAFLVFTSNLGIYRLDAQGERVPNVLPNEPYEAVRSKVKEEIERHFKLTLGRPEILNRLGENIMVFDFIREDVAVEIFDAMLGGLTSKVQQSQGVTVELEAAARQALQQLCVTDLSHGGRGIRNQLEVHFVNPLARLLFDQNVPAGAVLRVHDLRDGEVTVLEASF
ncbi:MAG: ATP-dependent Clp protease ATP-binding subunit [Verrucomicrobiales bacterium]|nr:ATP-dependent Clp protease ATP-binding subunit [Verrucomicrobiales bacterium]